MPKLVAILQSMADRTAGQNAQLYNDTVQRLKEMNIAVRYTNYMDEWDTNTPTDTDEKVRYAHLWYFAKLIEDISRCDAVVFNSDWGNTVEGTLLHAIVEALEVEELKMPEKTRYAMISQPMAGKTQTEIEEERDNLMVQAREAGYEVKNTYFKDEWQDAKKLAEQGVVNIPLFFLAKSLEAMSKCHAVVFSPKWETARGCCMEHAAAKAYGLEVLDE